LLLTIFPFSLGNHHYSNDNDKGPYVSLSCALLIEGAWCKLM